MFLEQFIHNNNLKFKLNNVMMLSKSPAYLLLTLLIILFFAASANAQQIKEYDSIYHTFNGYSGNAKFKYYQDEEKRLIKNGDFIFTSKLLDTLHKNITINIRWYGNYSKNIKSGSWKYEFNTHEVENVLVDNFDVDYKLHSEKEMIQGNYKEGRAEGKWSLNKDEFINGKRDNKLAEYNTNFKNSKISGPVEISYTEKGGNIVLVKGNAENGLMEGEWLFEYTDSEQQPVVEKRIYKRGFLIRLEKRIRNKIIGQIDFPLSPQIKSYLKNPKQKSEVVNKPLSLLFSDGYPRNSELVNVQQRGNDIIDTAIITLLKNEENFMVNFGLPLGTNRMHYELKRSEKKILEEWPDVEFEYRSRLNRLQTDKDLNFLYNEDETISMINAWLEKQLRLMDYIKSWNNILSRNEIIYYNRNNESLIEYTENLLARDTITYSGKEKIIAYEQGELEEKSFLFMIADNFKQRAIVADSLVNLYENKIADLKLNDNISRLKTDIQTSQMQLDTLFNPEIIPNEYKPLYNKFQTNYLGESFRNKYTLLDNDTIFMQDRIRVGDSLVQDIRLIKKIDAKLHEVTKNRQIIDSLYTEYVFDPFTFTDKVPTRIKKKLYEVVAEDVTAELLEKAEQATTLIEAYNYINQLILVQQRLIFFHDKETSKIERRLKKRAPLKEKLEILQI